jgi:hypothetical protein
LLLYKIGNVAILRSNRGGWRTNIRINKAATTSSGFLDSWESYQNGCNRHWIIISTGVYSPTIWRLAHELKRGSKIKQQSSQVSSIDCVLISRVTNSWQCNFLVFTILLFEFLLCCHLYRKMTIYKTPLDTFWTSKTMFNNVELTLKF